MVTRIKGNVGFDDWGGVNRNEEKFSICTPPPGGEFVREGNSCWSLERWKNSLPVRHTRKFEKHCVNTL